MIRSEKSSYMMPSRPPVETGIFLITARVLRSNIVTVESPPLVMNPRPDLGAKAMPCVRGVSGVRFHDHVSAAGNEHPSGAGLGSQVIGAAVTADRELRGLERLRGALAGPGQGGNEEQRGNA